MKYIMLATTYSSIKKLSTYTAILVGIAGGIIVVRILNILIEAIADSEKPIPWKSMRRHIIALILIVLVEAGLLNIVKTYIS